MCMKITISMPNTHSSQQKSASHSSMVGAFRCQRVCVSVRWWDDQMITKFYPTAGLPDANNKWL